LGDPLPPDVTAGTPVIALAPHGGLNACAHVLDQGAGQVLGVRNAGQRVGRLLIYIQPTRAAREAALGAAATLLRHLAVDATLLVAGGRRRSLGGSSYRDLLDLRHSALRGHGVDVRTESFDGSLADALRSRLSEDGAALLLLGITSTASARGLLDELDAALAATPVAATLIVRGDVGAASEDHEPFVGRAEASVG